MGNDKKTHYRKVFKSDHLGVADLEDMIEANSRLVFTIKHVKQEYGVKVAGRNGNFNIAYFKESIKPLVLNATNSKTMKLLSGGSAFVEDWKDIVVRLYIDHGAKMKGEVVGGVRISPEKPTAEKPELKPDTDAWKRAIAAYQRDGNFDAVEKHMTLSDKNKEAIKNVA